MAKIAISLADEATRQTVAGALAGTRHAVAAVEPPLAMEDGPAAVRDAIMALDADVIIMDYWPDDAASVKLMQAVVDMANRPEFIFVEGEGQLVEREQVLMAINEGARSFLPHDFQPAALASYVERAVSGPGRLRPKGAAPDSNGEAVSKLEAALGDARVRATSFQKLVDYLLATPLSAQNRKVLIVSDSPFQRETLKKLLDDHNFVATMASTSAEGVEAAVKEHPRIVVSDWELEDGHTGLELCQALKCGKKLIPLYFVICTANEDKVPSIMTPGNGVDDCILKPANQNDQMGFVSRVAVGLML